MKGKTGKMAPKKMQVGGSTMDRRAANAAKRQANFDSSMDRQKSSRDARMAELAKPGQERMAGYRAASSRLKDATAASRARRASRMG